MMALTYWACGSGNDAAAVDAEFPARMEALLKEAVADPRNIDAEKAATYVAEAERYADVRAGDTSAVYYLFKAAEVATVQRQYAKAIALYGRIEGEFSSHPRAPQALFMQAFTYDENLGQIETAREKYEEFIAKYPQDDFADDAQIMLDNLGKSDAEILRELESNRPAAPSE
jgi:tetratricopeptide (TPR) repeat protein